MKILIVGNSGGTNIGESLLVAARELGHEASLVPATDAFRTSQLRRQISWHLLGHKPPRLKEFSQRVLEAAKTFRPDLLIATGLAPINADVLATLTDVRRVVFLTDDPWNADFRAQWFFDALPHYDTVYTPRHANERDLEQAGCKSVCYLRFGYDPRHFFPDPQPKDVDAFFAGGADAERIRLLRPLLTGEYKVSLAGDFWKDENATRAFAAGHYSPDELRRATASAHVNICMVRAANRDGHVMRSFEIPAVGSAMIVQDTPDHRALFEKDVLYFSTPGELDAAFRSLMADSALRQRLATSVHRRIAAGRHTYKDRLATLIS
jgi:spore maturation protein CgeB